MNFSFNLIDEAWIPVIISDGDFLELSLRDTLARAASLREISCQTAIQSTAILPVALAILHRVFGPADFDSWHALWHAGVFDLHCLDEYFERWHERFDLFHAERPFMQSSAVPVEPKSLIHLIHPMGNTGTLFSHVNDEAGIALSPAEAAQYLLAARCFRTSGLGPSINGRRVSFSDCIFARGVTFWARGANLFETLMLNLLRYPDEGTMSSTGPDAPFWEMDDPIQRREAPRGYLDYLSWSNNRVQLIPEASEDGVIVRRAAVSPAINLAPHVRSPQRRYVQREKKGEITHSFLYFNADKALWRDYDSLLKREPDKVFPPAVVDWIADLKDFGFLEDDYHVQLMATGMLADQAKPVFYRQEIMPLPLSILRNRERAAAVARALKQAEDIAVKLRNALNILAEHVLLRGADGRPDNKDRNNLVRQWNARERYWNALEPRFWRFVEDQARDDEAAEEAWTEALRDEAQAALQYAARLAGGTPWALKGGIQAEQYLRFQLRELLDDNE